MSVFFKRLECSNKPKISGEQAQNYLAFHKYLDSEIALKFHKFDMNEYKQNVNFKF